MNGRIVSKCHSLISLKKVYGPSNYLFYYKTLFLMRYRSSRVKCLKYLRLLVQSIRRRGRVVLEYFLIKAL